MNTQIKRAGKCGQYYVLHYQSLKNFHLQNFIYDDGDEFSMYTQKSDTLATFSRAKHPLRNYLPKEKITYWIAPRYHKGPYEIRYIQISPAMIYDVRARYAMDTWDFEDHMVEIDDQLEEDAYKFIVEE